MAAISKAIRPVKGIRANPAAIIAHENTTMAR
jgi:hypothetical protein